VSLEFPNPLGESEKAMIDVRPFICVRGLEKTPGRYYRKVRPSSIIVLPFVPSPIPRETAPKAFVCFQVGTKTFCCVPREVCQFDCHTVVHVMFEPYGALKFDDSLGEWQEISTHEEFLKEFFTHPEEGVRHAIRNMPQPKDVLKEPALLLGDELPATSHTPPPFVQLASSLGGLPKGALDEPPEFPRAPGDGSCPECHQGLERDRDMLECPNCNKRFTC